MFGTGNVVALAPMERQQRIDAPVEGRIVKWHVSEGSRLSKGDPVAEMADLDPGLPARLQMERNAALERIRAIAEREQHLEKRASELDQSLKNEIAAAEFLVQQAQDRIRANQQTLDAATAKQTVVIQNRNRTARRKQGDAEARARQLEIRLGFLRDQVTAEVRDAASAVAAAHQRLQVLGDELRLSRELEEAERTRFELGEGTLFMLNVREQATLDAAVREALAQADYHAPGPLTSTPRVRCYIADPPSVAGPARACLLNRSRLFTAVRPIALKHRLAAAAKCCHSRSIRRRRRWRCPLFRAL
jgi:multidrug efflux pump subunit AcrA (membrane-fusion protein)